MNKEMSKVFTSLSLFGILSLNLVMPCLAQAPGATPGTIQGPIDIVANEQEFAGDAVIARGNVRVHYKDSIVLSPLATLYKDESGNPLRAIFTGHPRLTQGSNKIDAEELTFEIATQKIVAKGNAHSEVESSGPDDSPTSSTTKTVATSTSTNSEDENKPAVPEIKITAKKSETKKVDANKPVEHIVTDADFQEYDSGAGRFEALGHVRVKHGDIFVKSDKLLLVYGTNNKPETAVFTGKVEATQNRNSTCADTITYSLSTKRLQASGNVKSKVIQERKPEPKKLTPVANLLTPAAKATGAKMMSIDGSFDSLDPDKPIFILSDSQDYSKDNGRVSAHGNVRFVYGDTVGIGPSIILIKNADGKAERIIFKGRSQITQSGRRWIADSIVYVVAEHKIIAQGNTKAMIIQNQNQAPIRVEPPAPAPSNNTRLAEQLNAKRSTQ